MTGDFLQLASFSTFRGNLSKLFSNPRDGFSFSVHGHCREPQDGRVPGSATVVRVCRVCTRRSPTRRSLVRLANVAATSRTAIRHTSSPSSAPSSSDHRPSGCVLHLLISCTTFFYLYIDSAPRIQKPANVSPPVVSPDTHCRFIWRPDAFSLSR